jgi:hypothetical protein
MFLCLSLDQLERQESGSSYLDDTHFQPISPILWVKPRDTNKGKLNILTLPCHLGCKKQLKKVWQETLKGTKKFALDECLKLTSKS